jgi:hypothetical protein
MKWKTSRRWWIPAGKETLKALAALSEETHRCELILRKFRQLRRPEHRLVAHQQRRRDLRVAVLGRVEVEHELTQRPFQPRELPPQHHEPRARQPGGCLESIRPMASPSSKCWPRLDEVARVPEPVPLDVARLVRPDRHVRPRRVRDRGNSSSSAFPAAFSSASACGMASFSAATSAISTCARSSSFLAFACPISFDSAFRRS